MAKKIWALLSTVVLILTAVASPISPPEVSANGGTRLIVNDERVGPYKFRLGILPGSPKIGNLHISVLVQAAESDDAIQDGQIVVHSTGP